MLARYAVAGSVLVALVARASSLEPQDVPNPAAPASQTISIDQLISRYEAGSDDAAAIAVALFQSEDPATQRALAGG